MVVTGVGLVSKTAGVGLASVAGVVSEAGVVSGAGVPGRRCAGVAGSTVAGANLADSLGGTGLLWSCGLPSTAQTEVLSGCSYALQEKGGTGTVVGV